MKRIFIIHGWGDGPQSNWIPWLKNELHKKSFDVQALQMPNTNDPKIEEWVPYLKEQVGTLDSDTYFIAHSMGCQTVLRYFEQLDNLVKAGGVLFIAGFFTIRDEVMTGEAQRVLSPWVDSKIDLKKAAQHCGNFVCVASDNDPYIALEDSKSFESGLNAKIIVIPGAGHFTIEKGGYKELHVALNEILKMIK